MGHKQCSQHVVDSHNRFRYRSHMPYGIDDAAKSAQAALQPMDAAYALRKAPMSRLSAWPRLTLVTSAGLAGPQAGLIRSCCRRRNVATSSSKRVDC